MSHELMYPFRLKRKALFQAPQDLFANLRPQNLFQRLVGRRSSQAPLGTVEEREETCPIFTKSLPCAACKPGPTVNLFTLLGGGFCCPWFTAGQTGHGPSGFEHTPKALPAEWTQAAPFPLQPHS